MTRPPAPAARGAALIVVSDRAARGERADQTADRLRPVLAAAGWRLDEVVVVPDELDALVGCLAQAAARHRLVLTTGGTGVAPRDRTPEATRAVIDLEVPGLAEAMRAHGARRTPFAWGSRALAGFRGAALIVNLPGRPEGAVDAFGAVAPLLGHLVDLRGGPVSDASHEPPAGA